MSDFQQEADDAVRGFARRTFQGESTGIPRPPNIDVSESSLDPVRFDFQLGRGGSSQAFPGGGGSVPPPAIPCYQISVVSGTLVGTFTTLTGGCNVDVSASVTPGSTTLCFDDGNPIPSCSSCNHVINDVADTSPTFTPDTCTTCTGTFSAELDLALSGSDWILTIFNNFGVNCDCGGTGCAANNVGDQDPTFNLGSDPSGNHVFDFTGDASGAAYHFEIDIAAV